MRPTWDEYFLEIAQVVSGRSTCLRRQVGALVVKDKRILTTGYNGAPRRLAHCLDVGCLREEAGAERARTRALPGAARRAERNHPGGDARRVYRRRGPVQDPSAVRALHQDAHKRRARGDLLPGALPDELAERLLGEAGILSQKMKLEIDRAGPTPRVYMGLYFIAFGVALVGVLVMTPIVRDLARRLNSWRSPRTARSTRR